MYIPSTNFSSRSSKSQFGQLYPKTSQEQNRGWNTHQVCKYRLVSKYKLWWTVSRWSRQHYWFSCGNTHEGICWSWGWGFCAKGFRDFPRSCCIHLPSHWHNDRCPRPCTLLEIMDTGIERKILSSVNRRKTFLIWEMDWVQANKRKGKSGLPEPSCTTLNAKR